MLFIFNFFFFFFGMSLDGWTRDLLLTASLGGCKRFKAYQPWYPPKVWICGWGENRRWYPYHWWWLSKSDDSEEWCRLDRTCLLRRCLNWGGHHWVNTKSERGKKQCHGVLRETMCLSALGSLQFVIVLFLARLFSNYGLKNGALPLNQ